MRTPMNIIIIDGQGAGLGQTVIKKIRKEMGSGIKLVALGTNPTAASNMVKAGADSGMSGERDICEYLKKKQFDALIGPIGVLCSDGINGEITPMISSAIFQSTCTKYIIPLKNHGIYIPGTRNLEIKEIINEIVSDIRNSWEGVKN